ncbi:hypothetical protein FEF26_15205 [Nesterenkonia salmonea]|uniref:Uncharacterized protein n=1 Tax=Nesterenkonia salmonea TaxID=1804987 RepID=A0A5R9B342_9MICC|nr:hypothetical protein [Nesterenkonia salmonea]TLP90590.1 hypothetical protein FEF26_15205 [Nesterenkonia salmonea]
MLKSVPIEESAARITRGPTSGGNPLSEQVFFSSGDGSRRDFHSLPPGHRQLKQESILSKEAEQPKPPAVTADQPVTSGTAGEVDGVEDDRPKM